MNKTVIKELQKLMALCMEINSKTEHKISFQVNATSMPTFSVFGYKTVCGEIESVDIAEKINIPNINKCRQKLLKYKEW